eukprot:Skav211463  [mRNA]  locus=scaffold379:272828:276699:- [translate_table: standard]
MAEASIRWSLFLFLSHLADETCGWCDKGCYVGWLSGGEFKVADVAEVDPDEDEEEDDDFPESVHTLKESILSAFFVNPNRAETKADSEKHHLYGEEEESRRVEELAASLGSRAPPTEPVEYDVTEAALWEHRHISAGSVISFRLRDDMNGVDQGEVAVFVEEVENRKDGIDLVVKLAGAEDVGTRARLQSDFRKGKNRVHICYLHEGICPLVLEPRIHVTNFTWYPAGTFARPWVTSTGKKLVASGATMLGATKGKGGKPPGRRRGALKGEEQPDPEANKSGVDLQSRLKALRETKGRRVSFAGSGTRAEGEGGRRRASSKDGAGPPGAISDSAAVALTRVKEEAILVESEGEERRKKKKGEVAMRLAKQAQSTAAKAAPARKSRSRSRRRRKRRRRSSSGSRSKDSSRSRSSSSKDLMPPLKKRSQRDPGSVLRMLERQASEHLAKDGVLEEGETIAHLVGAKSLIYTYYQISLRGGLDPRGRDSKELAVLAKSLDLLREGQLGELGDTLAGRLMAVETSTRQGWQTAKHLEVHTAEDEGPVPAHILLAAQRHGRQVERAGGKGSWSSWDRRWPSTWQQDGSDKGKGKGKGKGAKNKARNKNQWTYKGEKDKGDTPPAKKD